MTDNSNLIFEYQEAIKDIYQKCDLKCLRGVDGNYKIAGKNLLKLYYDSIEPFKNKSNNILFNKIESDLFLISDEIVYFTANVILYEPHINDPLDDFYEVDGKFFFPNDQNIPAKRMDMYADICFEKLYNYWDRIGDLIAECIPTDLNEKNIYFTTVLEKIPNHLIVGDHINWLIDFRNNNFKQLNLKRKNVVHFTTSGTEFKFDHLKSHSDISTIKTLMSERRKLPNCLVSAIDDTIDGFTNIMEYLNVIKDYI